VQRIRVDQLEAWVLSVVDRVLRKEPIEDSRVELKSDWIPPQKAARRLAGHANASAGAPVLWIIGLHEVDGLVPFNAQDPAKWIAQLNAEFDGVAPDLLHSISVPSGGTSVYALLFDTMRRLTW